jgi:small-conductance mechanosensitive channel
LGVGFGLQKVISNLFSGFILLIDRSIKPGDVIQIDDTFGWVNSLGTRCVSLLTRDGVEYLVPNEHLITEKVTNWSYSSKNVRQKIPIGISYNADLRKAIELVVQVAQDHKRVLENPSPVCRVIAFGDSAIELELRIWISDPVEGVMNIRSDLLLGIWDSFKDNHIDVPFPQRDVHIKASPELKELLAGLK